MHAKHVQLRCSVRERSIWPLVKGRNAREMTIRSYYPEAHQRSNCYMLLREDSEPLVQNIYILYIYITRHHTRIRQVLEGQSGQADRPDTLRPKKDMFSARRPLPSGTSQIVPGGVMAQQHEESNRVVFSTFNSPETSARTWGGKTRRPQAPVKKADRYRGGPPRR